MWSSLGSDAEGFVKDWVRNIWSTLVSVCGSVSNFGNHISLHIHTWYIMIYHDVWRYKTPRFLLLTGICFFFFESGAGLCLCLPATKTKAGNSSVMNWTQRCNILDPAGWGGCYSRWWQLKHVWFSPQNPGEMIQFDEHIFQMGWFNHQLVIVWDSTWGWGKVFN